VASRLLKSAVALLPCLAALLLAGCGPSWSPVEKSTDTNGSYRATPDGYYRVRRGDSLHTIAFKLGMDWRDLAEWNGIRSPYTIYPDQDLRLTEPPSRSSGEVVTRPARTPAVTVSSDQPKTATAPREEASQAPTTSAGKPPVPAVEAAGTAASSPGEAAPARPASAGPVRDPAAWLWPTEGRLLSTFKANDPSRNGIEISGTEGQPIVAAATGEVVYSGSGLIGYGELIIVKHSDRMLSAYAHNRLRLVSEGQRVAAGEKLAEMGRDDRNKAMLHFEIRVNGVPQDPLKFLPRR
jgi:lipoprotein NlpD